MRGRGCGCLLILGIVVVGALYLFGAGTARGSVGAQCGPFLAPCTLTVVNDSYWPTDVDTTDITVDGNAAQIVGQHIVGPYGTATYRVTSLDGRVYTRMSAISFSYGQWMSGASVRQTLRLQGGR